MRESNFFELVERCVARIEHRIVQATRLPNLPGMR